MQTSGKLCREKADAYLKLGTRWLAMTVRYRPPGSAAFCNGEPAITQPLFDAATDAGQCFANGSPPKVGCA
jgi:hypothetical protein